MAWLLCLLIHFERRQLWWLFAATAFLGLVLQLHRLVITMPLYVAVTLLGLWTTSTRSARPHAVAVAGFLCPLLLLARGCSITGRSSPTPWVGIKSAPP
jgi:hypothetical protein